MGNQVRDIRQSGATTDTTYHIYDGHNTQLAVYHGDPAPAVPGADIMSIKERYLYGSDKLGTLRGSNIVGHYTTIGTYGGGSTFTVFLYVWGATPDREYELHDHLGNVRATISSRMPNSTGIVHLSNYYNYYAFGSYEPNRCFEPGGLYAFGFNGQEKKDDYKVPGAQNHALYWEYDTRIGRKWNLDPVIKAPESGYSCFGNNPIWHSDKNGDDYVVDEKRDKSGKLTNVLISAKVFIQGAGASIERAAELTIEAAKTYKTQVVEGVEVKFNIEYIFDPKKTASDLVSKLGENLLTFVNHAENNENPRNFKFVSQIFGKIKDDLYYLTGNQGQVMESGKSTYTVLHETLHLLGLSDRYKEGGGANKGYENDIMGVNGKTHLSISHYKNIVESVKAVNRIMELYYPKVQKLYSPFTIDRKYDINGNSELKK